MNTAECVSKFVDNDSTEFVVSSLIIEPSKIHGLLILRDGFGPGADIRPRSSRVALHPDICITGIDEVEPNVGELGPDVSPLLDLCFDEGARAEIVFGQLLR
jgi:hypothetical protein